jgi:hypothetical protein
MDSTMNAWKQKVFCQTDPFFDPATVGDFIKCLKGLCMKGNGEQVIG